jgi:hypothetical protein
MSSPPWRLHDGSGTALILLYIVIKCLRLGLNTFLHLSITDACFGHSLIKTVSLVVPDTLLKCRTTDIIAVGRPKRAQPTHVRPPSRLFVYIREVHTGSKIYCSSSHTFWSQKKVSHITIVAGGVLRRCVVLVVTYVTTRLHNPEQCHVLQAFSPEPSLRLATQCVNTVALCKLFNWDTVWLMGQHNYKAATESSFFSYFGTLDVLK